MWKLGLQHIQVLLKVFTGQNYFLEEYTQTSHTFKQNTPKCFLYTDFKQDYNVWWQRFPLNEWMNKY